MGIVTCVILCLTVSCSADQFFMPWYLNETKELMDLDVAIVRGMTKPYAHSQIRQVIADTYEFYSKLEDMCYMIESYDDTGFRIYDEFMHIDQPGVLKLGPHCIAVDYNETALIDKYNWTEKNTTDLIMNVRGILYSWNKWQQLRETFIITTTTTTTTLKPPKTHNGTILRRKFTKINSTEVTHSPNSTGKTRGTYKKRTTKSSTVKTVTTESSSSENITVDNATDKHKN